MVGDSWSKTHPSQLPRDPGPGVSQVARRRGADPMAVGPSSPYGQSLTSPESGRDREGERVSDCVNLIRVFVAEAEGCLTDLEVGLLALRARPRSGQALERVLRGTHTLKGNAASLGLVDVVDYSRALEAILRLVRDQAVAVTPGLVALLLHAVEELRQLVDACADLNERELEAVARTLDGDDEIATGGGRGPDGTSR